MLINSYFFLWCADRKVSPPELSATACTRTKLDMCYDGNGEIVMTALEFSVGGSNHHEFNTHESKRFVN